MVVVVVVIFIRKPEIRSILIELSTIVRKNVKAAPGLLHLLLLFFGFKNRSRFKHQLRFLEVFKIVVLKAPNDQLRHARGVVYIR